MVNKEHTHWGIWIAIIILSIIVAIQSTPFSVEKNSEEQLGAPSELSEQDVIFVFDEEEIGLLDEEGNLLRNYDYIKSYPEWVVQLEMRIKSEKRDICVEHQFSKVRIVDGYEIPPPEDYIFESYKSDVDCFTLDADWSALRMEQRGNIKEKSQYVKLSFMEDQN